MVGPPEKGTDSPGLALPRWFSVATLVPPVAEGQAAREPDAGGSRESLGVLLVVCLLGGCKGAFTSDKPLLNSNDASFPLPSGAEVAGQRLEDDHV